MTERALDRRHQDGAIRGTALALLILVGLGGWNYQKSYRADLENHRSLPFANYSTDDLQSLRFAYSEELERSQVIYGQRRSALGRGGGNRRPAPDWPNGWPLWSAARHPRARYARRGPTSLSTRPACGTWTPNSKGADRPCLS